MKTEEEVRQALFSFIRQNIEALKIAIVKSVDKAKSLAVVSLVEDDAIELPCRLQAVDSEQDNGFLIFPKVGSTVLISNIEHQGYYAVLMVSEVESIVLKINGVEKLNISENEIKFDSGSIGGLPKSSGLISRLNNVENALNTALSLIIAHVHPSNGVASPTLAALASASISVLADIENTKIKQ